MYPKSKYRLTPQRKVILEELRNTTAHPTADELYEKVRKRMPRISLGTVYRNLDMLSAQGVIQKLHFAESQMRFDGKTETHSHIYCIYCGKISDIEAEFDLSELLRDLDTDYSVKGYILNFYGICPSCQNQNKG